MNPEATLREIRETMHGHSDLRSVVDCCRALREWIDRGGFQPHWEREPIATARYRRFERTGK